MPTVLYKINLDVLLIITYGYIICNKFGLKFKTQGGPDGSTGTQSPPADREAG